jgi:hypothetical protein
MGSNVGIKANKNALFFFCLETEETKIQGCKIACTRAGPHRLQPRLTHGSLWGRIWLII